MVTGGAPGIGGGISRATAAAGAHVVLADIDGDAVAATRDEIIAAAGDCTNVVGDIRDRDSAADVTEPHWPLLIRESTSWSKMSGIFPNGPERATTDWCGRWDSNPQALSSTGT